MSEKADEGRIARREILQGLVAGLGASIAVPGLAAERPATAPAAAAEVRSRIAAADWKPAFLDEHQMATVEALCGRILPGSREALAPRFIDAVLAVDSWENRSRFVTACGAVDGEALARHQKPFRALAETQQDAILTTCATGTSAKTEWIWTPGTPVVKPPDDPGIRSLRDHFDHLKGWIADAYYSSPEGLKELGDKGHLFFASFPDCQHAEHA